MEHPPSSDIIQARLRESLQKFCRFFAFSSCCALAEKMQPSPPWN
jgi:hypothetical protein